MSHILVVDDDDLFCALLEHMLIQDGHKVTIARDGKEGLRLSQEVMADVIITDVLMPNMDGIELIMALIKSAGNKPIIAMSGGRRSISAEFNLESATLVGVKATLCKPFTKVDLRQAIQKALA